MTSTYPSLYLKRKLKLCSVILPGKTVQYYHNPPASEASREVANLTERKNPHTPIYGVKEFFCLSVINFDPKYTIVLT